VDDGGLQRIGGRALCAVVCARVVGTLLVESASLLHELGKAAWMVESHFGRRYQVVTGVDLAETVGEPGYVYAELEEDDDDAS
jgi:hypothetical protein